MTIQEMVDYLNSHSCPDSLFYKLEELTDQNNIVGAISCIQGYFECNSEVANQVFVEYKKQIYNKLKKIDDEIKSSLTPQQIAHASAVAKESLNKPKCPICNSVNIKKISGVERVTSIAMMGIFSKKINKSFKCNNCGGTF